MCPEEEQRTDTELREMERVQEFLRPRLDRAERIYTHALTSLWVGNGAAITATLTGIGSTWKDGEFYRPLLWPFIFFLLGLIAMGVGSLSALIREGRAINRMQYAKHFLDFQAQDINSPREEIGLTFSDPRTLMGLLSGVLFVSGCASGLIQLVCAG